MSAIYGAASMYSGYAGANMWQATSATPQNNSANAINGANAAQRSESEIEKAARKQIEGCKTCENRRYQDRSDDSGVSFQAPTKLGRMEAEGAVRSHEAEHVAHNKADAAAKGGRVEYSSVSISYAVCEECGTSYVSGGLTTTVTSTPVNNGQAKPYQNAPELDMRI